MTDAVKIALIAAVPLLAAQITTIVIGLINKRQGKEIHVLVDGNMTAMKQELADMKSALAASNASRISDLKEPKL